MGPIVETICFGHVLFCHPKHFHRPIRIFDLDVDICQDQQYINQTLVVSQILAVLDQAGQHSHTLAKSAGIGNT